MALGGGSRLGVGFALLIWKATSRGLLCGLHAGSMDVAVGVSGVLEGSGSLSVCSAKLVVVLEAP